MTTVEALSSRLGQFSRSGLAVMIGTGILLASLVGLAIALAGNWADILQAIERGIEWRRMALGGVLYAACIVTTALAWPAILRCLDTPVRLRETLAIGFVSQLGKYVPGNVAHQIGRAALARKAGISLTTTVKSAVIEIGYAVAACGAVTVGFGLPATVSGVSSEFSDTFAGWTGWITIGVSGAAALGIVAFAIRTATNIGQDRRGTKARAIVAVPLMAFVFSFLLAGLSFALVIDAIAEAPPVSYRYVISLYAVAWLVGFVTPGAPAGIGVREAIIFGGLVAPVGSGVAMLAAILHRAISALAELAIAAAGCALLIADHRLREPRG